MGPDPRHRLVRNLIAEKQFGEAEVAISEGRDLGINDSVIHRYDVSLNVSKAENLNFLEETDRINLLETAVAKANRSLTRRPDDMYNYESLCSACLTLARRTGSLTELITAIESLKVAHQEIGDDLMIGWIAKYESELARLRNPARAVEET